MHPFHSEMRADEVLDARRRDAAHRRLVAEVRPALSDRTGSALVGVGERLAHAGRRLQAAHRRTTAAPCLEGC